MPTHWAYGRRENILIKKDKIWVPGLVLKILDNNSFIVKDDEGHTYRRNRVYLSKTNVAYKLKTNLIDHFDNISRPQCNMNSADSLFPNIVQDALDNNFDVNVQPNSDEDVTMTQEDNQSSDSDSYFSSNESEEANTNVQITKSGRASKPPTYLQNYVT